jgi:glyoxylase-like metal-dependent hydrolase (beta-lactamase superfamily II)
MTRRRSGGAHLTKNVAPGIHRLEHAFVNIYLIEGDGGVTVVDSGLPRAWPFVTRALRAVGRSSQDVEALVLTHGHFDHIGSANRMVSEWQVPAWLHPADDHIAGHPYDYLHERSRLVYPLRYPRSVPILAKMAEAGALEVPAFTASRKLVPGDVIDVPGRPRVLFTPGHTFGHVSLHLPERGVVITGDALVTLDPYSGKRGAQIVSGAATADSAATLESLDELLHTEAGTALPGHGEPWRDGIRTAVADARRAGPS